ncbi:MAG TPA: J domain-containing protein [Acidimicrobiales bacterium]|nr:J domain-containing protein [Acidimicrobiales bacterium]
MDGANAYALLGLDVNASRDDVTSAFRAAAQRCHPDHGGDRREFEQIYEAYSVLRALPVRRPNPFLRFDDVVVRFDAYDSRRRPPRAVTFEEELARAMRAA